MNIWLFDLDGVLIRPGGYRAALIRTTEYFAELFGLDGVALSDSDIDVFEAFGITSEWDSSAICAAFMLYRLWQTEPDLPPAPNMNAATDFPKASKPVSLPMYFGTVARQVGVLTAEGGYPADGALSYFLRAARQERRAHPSLIHLEGWLRLFLENTRDFRLSPTIRVFQAYVLGEQSYRETYRAEPPLPSPSLLEELDQPNLGLDGLRIIQDAVESEKIGAAVFTSRPTRPLSLRGVRPDNSPEAELSLRALDLHLPIAGYGQMLWLSDMRRKRTDAYIKPSPVHALAAIGLASGVEDSMALEAARSTVEEGILHPALRFLMREEVRIHLFEDTPTGIRSLQHAARILENRGVLMKVNLIGVTDSDEKEKALQGMGARVFGTMDQALSFAAGQLE